MIKEIVKKKVEDAFPKVSEYPGKVPKKIVMVTESETNVKITCPFCDYPNMVKMGKGVDTKFPNRVVRYSAIPCQNRMCKKNIVLSRKNQPDGKKKYDVKMEPDFCLNTFVWDATDVYITEKDKLVVLLEIGKSPMIDRINMIKDLEQIIKEVRAGVETEDRPKEEGNVNG